MDLYLRRCIYNEVRNSGYLLNEEAVWRFLYLYDSKIFKGELGRIMKKKKIVIDIDLNKVSERLETRLLCFDNRDSLGGDEKNLSSSSDGDESFDDDINSFISRAEAIFGTFSSTESSSSASNEETEDGFDEEEELQIPKLISYDGDDYNFRVTLIFPNTKFFEDSILDIQYKIERAVVKLLCFAFEVNPLFVYEKLIQRLTLKKEEGDDDKTNCVEMSDMEKDYESNSVKFSSKTHRLLHKLLLEWSNSKEIISFLSESYTKTPLRFSSDVHKIFGEAGLIYKKTYSTLFGDFREVCYMTDDTFAKLKKEHDEVIEENANVSIDERCAWHDISVEFCMCPESHHGINPKELCVENDEDVNCLSLETILVTFLFSSTPFFKKMLVTRPQINLEDFSYNVFRKLLRPLPVDIVQDVGNEISDVLCDYLNKSSNTKKLIHSNFKEVSVFLKFILSSSDILKFVEESEGEVTNYFVNIEDTFNFFRVVFFDPCLKFEEDIYRTHKNGLFVETAESFISGNWSDRLKNLVDLCDTSHKKISVNHPLIQELNGEMIVFTLPPEEKYEKYYSDTTVESDTRRDFSRIANSREYMPFEEYILNGNYRLSTVVLAKNYHTDPISTKYYYTISRCLNHELAKEGVCKTSLPDLWTYSYESSDEDEVGDEGDEVEEGIESINEKLENSLEDDYEFDIEDDDEEEEEDEITKLKDSIESFEEQEEEVYSSSYYSSTESGEYEESDDDSLSLKKVIPEEFIRFNIYANTCSSEDSRFKTRAHTEIIGSHIDSEKLLRECFIVNKKTRPIFLIYEKI